MEWCKANGVDFVFRLAGSRPLSAKVEATADAVRTERALTSNAVVRGYAEPRHKAKSWTRERRAVARLEATPLGLDIRFIVTNLRLGTAEWLYDNLYCARGLAENLIKLHKTDLVPLGAGQPDAPRASHRRLRNCRRQKGKHAPGDI